MLTSEVATVSCKAIMPPTRLVEIRVLECIEKNEQGIRVLIIFSSTCW